MWGEKKEKFIKFSFLCGEGLDYKVSEHTY